MSFSGNRTAILMAAAGLILFLTAGCSRTEDGGGSRYVRFRLESDPTTLDPALIVDVTGGSIAARIFNGLVRLDETMSVINDLCETYEVSGDGTLYTFSLRRGVKFHCGKELTAEDVRYSFERVLSRETLSPRARVLERIRGAAGWQGPGHVEGISVDGPYTLALALDEPYAVFLQQLTVPAAFVVCRSCMSDGGRLCGTGPYGVQEWKHDLSLTLRAFGNYFGQKPAGIDGLIYYVVPEDFTAMAELRKGRLDVVEVPAALLQDFRKRNEKGISIEEGMTLSTYYIGFNCRKGLFSDVRYRQAAARAVNRDKLVKHLMEDTVVRADGPVPPVLPGSLDIDPYPCDPSQLKEMIVQANLPEDFRASFLASSTSQNADIASAVASDLEAAGLRIDMQMRDWSAFKEAVNSGEADMFFLSWWADIPDGIDFLFPTFHSANAGAGGNRSFFSSPAVDAMIETAMKTADAAERAKLYAGISQAVVRECPWIFLWHKKSYYAVSKRMRGFRVFPMYMIDKGEWYSLKAGK